ncbi:PRD domain-containing protein [Porcipelethomonas sp.]|uniref:PRD domain-containing protein n=1 Tax=Porcipelethomonas sp. TaxID=2981675 RepID=UPI003EF7C74C
MKIIKVINNNNVCVLNEKGREQIVSGKGIGFGKKYGDSVDSSRIQKTYLFTDSALQKKLMDLMTEIPYEYIKFTSDMVEYIKECIPSKLNESLLITLSDHICFAIERKKQGIEFTNPLIDSIRECYPEELKLGFYCLEQIEKRLGITLHKDEAGFIAMHIINARLYTDMSEVYDITKLIDGCVKIAEDNFTDRFDRTTSAYERFMIHMKYMSQRLFKNESCKEILGKDKVFTEFIRSDYDVYYSCAKTMQKYILETYGKNINEDEVITITLHLVRVVSESEKAD